MVETNAFGEFLSDYDYDFDPTDPYYEDDAYAEWEQEYLRHQDEAYTAWTDANGYDYYPGEDYDDEPDTLGD